MQKWRKSDVNRRRSAGAINTVWYYVYLIVRLNQVCVNCCVALYLFTSGVKHAPESESVPRSSRLRRQDALRSQEKCEHVCRIRSHPLLHDVNRAGATCAPQTQAGHPPTPPLSWRWPGVWRGAVRAMPTVKTGLLSCCLRGRQHPGMCKNSDAALRLDSFAFVASLQKRTAETPGSQRFPLIALCVFCV